MDMGNEIDTQNRQLDRINAKVKKVPEALSTNMRINYFTGLSYEAGKYVSMIIINAMK